MQRPVMNPTYVDDAPRPPQGPRRAAWLKAVGRAALALWRLLMAHPFSFGRRGRERAETGSAFSRFVRGLFYRLAFVPLVAAVVAGLSVYAGTHPSVPLIEKDPTTIGVYYDPISFVTPDGCRLDGWLAPVIDAKKVVEEQDRVLRTKWPAVVLVHDHAQSREEMLPLVRPLHEAGFVVLTISLRGDEGPTSVGHTFGLNEALDVSAAVDVLRRRPFVDPTRVAVVGVGTGAVATALAADRDTTLRGSISIRPPLTPDEVLRRCVVPDRLPWIAPICRWTFEIAYGVNTRDLDVSNLTRASATHSPLVLRSNSTMDDPILLEKVVGHLFDTLEPHKAMVRTD